MKLLNDSHTKIQVKRLKKSVIFRLIKTRVIFRCFGANSRLKVILFFYRIADYSQLTPVSVRVCVRLLVIVCVCVNVFKDRQMQICKQTSFETET